MDFTAPVRVQSRVMKPGFTQLIRDRLAELHMSPRQASLDVSDNPELIRSIIRGGDEANPRRDTLELLAKALRWSLPQLLTETDRIAGLPHPLVGRNSEVVAARGISMPDPVDMARDLPVLGTAAGSLVDDKIEGFQFFGGDPIEYVRRPPALERVPNAYAIYVTGESMDPMHRPGELRFVHPGRPAAPGDTVIVSTQHWEHDPGQGYIKLFRRRTGDRVILEQINPRATIEIPVQYVMNMHRVLTMNELFGL